MSVDTATDFLVEAHGDALQSAHLGEEAGGGCQQLVLPTTLLANELVEEGARDPDYSANYAGEENTSWLG